MSKVYHNKFSAMGTRFFIILPGLDHDHADQVYRVIMKLVQRLEEDLSWFIPESEISRINKEAAQRPVPVGEEVFEILQTCRKYYELTEGAFDITLRPLLEYWKDKSEEETSREEVDELLNAVGMRYITLNEENQTVSFDSDRIEIDLGGFGKGYALQQVKRILYKFSVTSAFISFGESSILTMGHHPAGDHWKVGMKDYLNPDQALHTFLVQDGSVSTSSNFYTDDQGRLQNHRHVIDPFEGYPVAECKSVSICSGSAVMAEMLSTAFLVSSDEFIASLIKKMVNLDAIKVTYTSDAADVKRFTTEEEQTHV